MYKRYYDIDVDAKAYANNIVKAGGRIPSDINSVSDFIRRLKQNNLFNSVADMWFLRSGQNIGSGSRFYALKSLNNPCILINGPTIAENGIRTALSSSQYLRLLTPEIFHDFTVFVVGTNVSSISTSRIFTFQRAAASTTDSVNLFFSGPTLLVAANTAAGAINLTSTGYNINSYGFQSFAVSSTPTASIFRRSNVTTSTGGVRLSRSFMKNVIYCGGIDAAGTNSPTNFSNFVYSAVFLFSPNINNNYTSIYDIYKATAGKGLGLP